MTTPTKPPRLPKGRTHRLRFAGNSTLVMPSVSVKAGDVTHICAVIPCKSAREAKALVKLHADPKALLDAVPTNWLDPMLTGPAAVLSKKPGSWNCHDIERLMFAVRERLAAKLEGRP
jgi:hypothetical protein